MRCMLDQLSMWNTFAVAALICGTVAATGFCQTNSEPCTNVANVDGPCIQCQQGGGGIITKCSANQFSTRCFGPVPTGPASFCVEMEMSCGGNKLEYANLFDCANNRNELNGMNMKICTRAHDIAYLMWFWNPMGGAQPFCP